MYTILSLLLLVF